MRIIFGGLSALLCTLFLISCNDAPAIQKSYDFSLSSWYLQKSVKCGEEVEIRFYLSREGNYKDAEYRIGYVQVDGSGRVYDTARRILTNREAYDLDSVPGLDKTNSGEWVFTMFYRPNSDKKSELRFFVTDNFGLEREYLVTFSVEQ